MNANFAKSKTRQVFIAPSSNQISSQAIEMNLKCRGLKYFLWRWLDLRTKVVHSDVKGWGCWMAREWFPFANKVLSSLDTIQWIASKPFWHWWQLATMLTMMTTGNNADDADNWQQCWRWWRQQQMLARCPPGHQITWLLLFGFVNSLPWHIPVRNMKEIWKKSAKGEVETERHL